MFQLEGGWTGIWNGGGVGGSYYLQKKKMKTQILDVRPWSRAELAAMLIWSSASDALAQGTQLALDTAGIVPQSAAAHSL